MLRTNTQTELLGVLFCLLTQGFQEKIVSVMSEENLGFLLEVVLNPGYLLASRGIITYKFNLTRGFCCT